MDSNDNGFTVPIVGEGAQFMLAEEAVFGELGSLFTPTVLQQHATVDGADTVKLRLRSPITFPIDVFVDSQTGAYRRITIDPDGKYEETINGIDYTTIGSRRFLSSWHYGTQTKTVHAFSKIVVNEAMAADRVHPPTQTATWTFGDTPAKVDVVTPVNLALRLYVHAIVNGVPGKFILDTGAGLTGVRDSFARKIQAKRAGTADTVGIGGGMKANSYDIDTIQLGGSTLHHVRAQAGIDEEGMDEGVDGLLGYDILAGSVATLSLDAGTLTLADPTLTQADTNTGIVLHPDLTDGQMRVPMTLNGKISVIATLDSGMPDDTLFSNDLIDRDHLPFFVAYLKESGGVSGSEIDRCGRLQSLTLGPVTYQTPPACASGSFAKNEIIVGLDFMKAFNFVFDYPHDTIVLNARKA